MARERRDSKNRILRTGEYQKSDGRYMYRYKDTCGVDRYVYSWTLTQTDRVPQGRTPGKCLRELEKEIAQDIHDQIDAYSARQATLNLCYDNYMKMKYGLKETTRQDYENLYNTHIRETLGNCKIASLKYSQMMAFYSGLLTEKNLSIGTVGNIFNLINPVFRIAVRDRLIRDNPQTGIIGELKKSGGWKPEKRHALTVEQQRSFFTFLKNHPKFNRWWPILTTAVGTGCRVGELIALTWDDCDFANDIIMVRKNLVSYKNKKTDQYELHITTPKSSAGIREIPMLPEVKAILQEEKKYQLKYGFCEDVIDGCSGFIFTNMQNRVIHPRTITAVVKRFIDIHNDQEIARAKLDGHTPVILPKFSMHTFRHTFCTRLCESGVNLKVVQEVMGHATSAMTMDVYNEATLDCKKEAFDGLREKIVV